MILGYGPECWGAAPIASKLVREVKDLPPQTAEPLRPRRLFRYLIESLLESLHARSWYRNVV